jgi:excisionase family DNA binding protein
MQDDGQMALDIVEAAKRLSLSPRTVASLIKSGELHSLKVGRRRIVPIAAITEFLRGDHPTKPEAGDEEANTDDGH